MAFLVVGWIWMLLATVGAALLTAVDSVYSSCLQRSAAWPGQLAIYTLAWAPGLALALLGARRRWPLAAIAAVLFFGPLLMTYGSYRAACGDFRPETAREAQAWTPPAIGQALRLDRQPCGGFLGAFDHVLVWTCDNGDLITARAGREGWIRRVRGKDFHRDEWIERTPAGADLVRIDGAMQGINLATGARWSRPVIAPPALGPAKAWANPAARCLIWAGAGLEGSQEVRVYRYEPGRRSGPLDVARSPELRFEVRGRGQVEPGPGQLSNGRCLRRSDGQVVLYRIDIRGPDAQPDYVLVRHDASGAKDLAAGAEQWVLSDTGDARRLAVIPFGGPGPVVLVDADHDRTESLAPAAGRRWLAFDAATRSGVQTEAFWEAGVLRGVQLWALAPDGREIRGPRTDSVPVNMTANAEPGRFVLLAGRYFYWPLK